ncbi:hypothetical protein [Pantoea sp. 1.19]|uniref:hypothetical protein n=1 Tax=Pantoea sp. 1.19 TaxID=1925589 RepID=UPI000948944D|nr:hypothetical protein [Pantoea sp. 1.19]
MTRSCSALLLLPGLLLIGCQSPYQGKLCRGEVSTLAGQTVGISAVHIVDRVDHFTVRGDGLTLESGPLHSANRLLYLPASVTREGYLAQRLSDTQFRLASAREDRMITWVCPSP